MSFQSYCTFWKAISAIWKKEDKRNETTVVFIPKSTCTINICCLAVKESSTTPNSEQLINLSIPGLGKKRVVFQTRMEIITFFKKLWRKTLEKCVT